MPDKAPYFIVGSGRSGTTSLATILDTAKNGYCLIEPTPNLNIESRLWMDGVLENTDQIVDQLILPRLTPSTTNIHGEKQVTLAGFIPQITKKSNAKFVFVHRDGRDVVRSWLDWHNQMFGTIYRECHEHGELSNQAITNAGELLIKFDESDFSRPRPNRGDPLFGQWLQLSRFQMCSYYWQKINHLHIKALEHIDPNRWISINYTKPSTDSVEKVIDFLGLTGITSKSIKSHLSKKINSLSERQNQNNIYPCWTNWNSRSRNQFWNIAGKTMIELGYSTNDRVRWKPSQFGAVWSKTKNIAEWYEWMFEGRRKVHEHFLSWFKHQSNQTNIKSIADFGSGIGHGYVEALKSFHYTGFDISPEVVEFANKRNNNHKHIFKCVDYISDDLNEQFDIVFSSGTIDNSYDIDEYIQSMVRNAVKWIYLTSYRGWFPWLKEHSYIYNEEQKCFYNHLSPDEIYKTLLKLDCKDIEIFPIETGNDLIPYETVILARV